MASSRRQSGRSAQARHVAALAVSRECERHLCPGARSVRFMEFERALFRIHQHALHADRLRPIRISAETWLPRMWVVLVICLATLHSNYVGQAHCLPAALKHAGLWNTSSDQPSLPEDVLLSLVVTAGDELLDTGISLHQDVTPGTRTKMSNIKAAPGFSVASANASAFLSRNKGDSSASRRALRAAIMPDPSAVLVSYKFALDREVIALRKSVFEAHNFEIRNVSVSESCLMPWRTFGELMTFFGALDTLIINELAYTFRSRGFLERVHGDVELESWAWSAEQVEAASPEEGRSLPPALVRKMRLLLRAVITYIMISAMSGFFIRVAVNGAAVMMFPMALCLQAEGGGSRISVGVLIRSFPWIGIHVEVLRRAGRSAWPLFKSHLAFLFFQSFAYMSCNLALRFMLYRKSSPEDFEEKMFSLCSLLELFNLIFVRTVNSATVFPKLVSAIMVYLQFYLFASLYPFHVLALMTATCACLYVMVYCLNNFEEPALRSDPFALTTPTTAHPRALYMPQLSPSWALESPPLWTMFYLPDPPSEYPPEAMHNISNEEYLMP
mmetsp:Transcript_57182/g.165697  ORF Transcript_57182/g.165697 Transcript_57182/m.165697 type:complete len:557 (-) Transcript_57182:46-1716(-)